MTNLLKQTSFFLLCGALAFGCGDDDAPEDMGTDMTVTEDMTVGEDMTVTEDMNVPDSTTGIDPTCENLCTAALADCSGNPAAYANMTECMSWCSDIGAWEAGTAGDTDGNTIACRITAIAAGNCDAGGFTGGSVCGSYCENYCNNIANTCEGSDAQYASPAECMTTCEGLNQNGDPGTTEGNSIQCRIYHGGVPADMMPETHCNHAGPTGLNEADGAPICAFDNKGFDFRPEGPAAFTRVDRMGMPAVSTALATNKSAYNDGDPSDDAALTFATELITNLAGLHTALDPDITDTMGVTACSMQPPAADQLPPCLSQPVVAGGPSVVSLVVPDTLTLDVTAASGFPNGRLLTDPVMDVTLAVILLDMTVNTPTDLVGVLNPAANDKDFRADFPYLAEEN